MGQDSTTGESWSLRFEPRRWQTVALSRWREKNRGVVSVVTGGGKTAFALMCMEEFHTTHPEGRVIIVVPTAALLDQWHVALTEDLAIPAGTIACYSGEEKPEKPLQVNILIINTARELTQVVNQGAPSFLVVDECHRAGSPHNARSLRGDFAAALGLSATPRRQYDRGFEQYVVPSLGPIIYEYDYTEARGEGVICPFDLINVEVPLLDDEATKYAGLTRRCASELQRVQSGCGSEEKLKRLLQQRAAVSATATMRIPVACALVEGNRGQRTLVFHERVKCAEKIANALNERRHSVTTYHSRIRPALRRHNLLLFRRGVFDVLVCCRALDEGMDVPETTIAVIASSTASTRQRIQRLGRVLRPARGKQGALIYTLYATAAEEGRLQNEANSMVGLSEIRWQRVRVPDGQNPREG
jgi:superfamily II DNA or RNA helicase